MRTAPGLRCVHHRQRRPRARSRIWSRSLPSAIPVAAPRRTWVPPNRVLSIRSQHQRFQSFADYSAQTSWSGTSFEQQQRVIETHAQVSLASVVGPPGCPETRSRRHRLGHGQQTDRADQAGLTPLALQREIDRGLGTSSITDRSTPGWRSLGAPLRAMHSGWLRDVEWNAPSADARRWAGSG